MTATKRGWSGLPYNRAVRAFARHLALRVVPHGKGYVLCKVYGDRRRVSGVFRSIAGVERGLDRRLRDPAFVDMDMLA
jgi:hypothetical protein